MKKIIAIFAFIGILLQSFSSVVIVADYYVHKDFIAKNLCENKDKPQMHCEGKCCLKKKLAKESKDQAPSPRNQKSEQTVNLFYSESKFELKNPGFLITTPLYFSYDDLHTCGFQHTVFHPPAA